MNGIEYHRLRNGQLATLRPARAEDAPLILAMHHRLSSRSVYRRYHRHYEPSLAAIEALCRLSADEGAAFVATIDAPTETVIGMAYYLLEEEPSQAEPALLVEDRFQGMGLGRRMGQYLAFHATARGIRTFNAYVLSDNDAMLKIIKRGGLAYHSEFAYGAWEIHLELVDSPSIPLLMPVFPVEMDALNR